MEVRKLLNHAKPFAATIIAIIMLLFVQAVCDLALPGYTSDIVNVGIQQNGIENAVPKAIRKTEMEKLLLLMDDSDKAVVLESYSLLDKDSFSPKEFDDFLQDFPKLSQELVYGLNARDKTAFEKLDPIIGRAIVLLSGIENKHLSVTAMSPAQLDGLKKMAGEKMNGMPDSMVTQSSAGYIRSEYEALGMSTAKLQTEYIIKTGGIMLLVSLLSMAVAICVAYLGARVAAGFSRDLRKSVFEKVVSFSNNELDKFSTASLITRNTNDIFQIQMFMIMLFRIVIYAPIIGTGGILKVLGSEHSMGWIIAVGVAAILLLVSFLFGTTMPKFKVIQTMVDRLNLVTREMLSGMLVVRAFNNEDFEEKRFDIANRDLTRTNLFVNRVMALMNPAMMLIMNGITLLIIWVGGHQIENGAMQVGDMMAFIQYTMQVIMSFLMISMVSIMLPRAAVSAARVAEVLNTEVAVKDLPVVTDLAGDKESRLEFKDVSFKYPGAEANVLSDISFSAFPGQTTAFIGSTGCGKTTLVSLILRLYDVTSGEISINGVDIRKLSLHELRNRIGYVPQKSVLFSGTVESNVGYGVDEASEEELYHAVKTAQAMGFINENPEGLKASVSQGGMNFSGGQKQRLAIARALAKKPQIFIFDDSFSALDFTTDAALRKALKSETLGSTVLIVAQRVSTIMDADQIVVLEEGKIVGTGTHKELIRSCKVYQQIALSQLSAEELAI